MEEWKWTMGRYKFKTKEGYMAGLQDMKKIAKIKDGADINNPEEAKKLYINLVERRFFHTQVGGDFLRLLKKNAGMEQEEKVVSDGKKKTEQRNIRILFAGAAILIILLVIFHIFYQSGEQQMKKAATSFITTFYEEKNMDKAKSYMTADYAVTKEEAMKNILSYINIKEISYKDVTQFQVISSGKTSASVKIILQMNEKESESNFDCKLKLKKVSGAWKVSYFDCENEKER